MTIVDLLFNTHGRINRLTYLGLSVVCLLTFFALIIAAAANWGGGAGPFALLSIPVVIIALVGNAWTAIALTVKRLHDLNETGYHIVWIILLDLSVQALSRAPPEFNIVTLMALCVSLGIKVWLVTAPGTAGLNDYGAPSV